MGDGNFIMALNTEIRKKLKKRTGTILIVEMGVDESPVLINNELLECLCDDPEANAFFNTLTKGHQKYFSNWISAAKTTTTKAKRIADAVNALSRKQNYGQMLNNLKI
jgi:uncharacterized protein YdeI (YjbR/CyaY-like superfamily)